MIILALDTTSAGGSLALASDGDLMDESTGNPNLTHGEQLPGELQLLLDRNGLTSGTIDRYAVAAGPGSFTGLRVGIATIQGLALVHNRRVVPISVLDALVEAAKKLAVDSKSGPEIIVPFMDAKRGEVFSNVYAPSRNEKSSNLVTQGGNEWTAISEPVAMAPKEFIEIWAETLAGQRVLVIGDGVQSYGSLLTGQLGDGSSVFAETPPLAGVIAVMASVVPWCYRGVRPHQIRPLYVRRPDAEISRDKRRHRM